MSSIHNRITTTFTAQGGQALAVMGQISGGMMNIGRQTDRMGQQVGNVERQWRALGTTIRYALAGTAVFAIPNAIRQLSEVQQQLGLMSAIGQDQHGLPIVGQQLRQLGQDAQKGAIDAITPVQDFNNAVVNFLSTVQGVPPDKVTEIVTNIAQAAKLAQVPVEDATKAFTTMSVAFGKPVTKQDIGRTAQEFFTMTRFAPGGVAAGAQVIQQLGQLAQVTRLAGGTRPDLFALLLTTLRAGIPPAQAGRGLQFMIQTLGLPGRQEKESRQALASVGILPGKPMTLRERLARVFGRARQLGVGGDLSRITRLDDETLNTLDEQGATPGDLGITGPGGQFLGQVFHRVHSLRTALALYQQTQGPKGNMMLKDLARMDKDERDQTAKTNTLASAWERLRKQSRLKEAANAVSTMQLQIAQAFEPILDPVARGLTATAKAAQGHRDATKYAAWVGGSLAALYGIGRITGMRIPGGQAIGRFGRLGRGIPMAAAVQQELSGQIPKGTPTDPLYVMVVSQLFGGGRGRIPVNPNQYPTPIGPMPGPAGRGGRRFPMPLGWTGPTIVAAAVLAQAGSQGMTRGRSGNWVRRHYPSLFAMGVEHINPSGGFVFRDDLPEPQRKALSKLHRDHSTGEVNRILRDRMTRIYTNAGGAAGASATQIAMAVLKGTAELEIVYNQPDGSKSRKKVHVRTDNWDKGNTPQHRGRPRSNRR